MIKEGSFERCNEPSGSIKRWEVLEWLHNWQLLKKGSAPWVSDVSEWGNDQISSELIQAGGEILLFEISKLINYISIS
jgi:hypothetical protein